MFNPVAVAGPGPEKKFSGLYVYHIPTSSWRLIQDDTGSGGSQGSLQGGSLGQDPGSRIKSRTGHSMLFHPGNRKLYIFGGQRKRDDYLNDFFTYRCDDVMCDDVIVMM